MQGARERRVGATTASATRPRPQSTARKPIRGGASRIAAMSLPADRQHRLRMRPEPPEAQAEADALAQYTSACPTSTGLVNCAIVFWFSRREWPSQLPFSQRSVAWGAQGGPLTA